MPAPLSMNDPAQEPLEALPALNGWVRGTLLGITAGLVTVFAIAFWLNPYEEDGTPRTMETHRQLGLPPCTFKYATGGLPCPSCGMTTSFSLLMHGDVWNSLKANAAGTLLAVICLTIIPWSIGSIVKGRPLFIVSLERALTRIVVAFVGVMLLRWILVLGITWWQLKHP